MENYNINKLNGISQKAEISMQKQQPAQTDKADSKVIAKNSVTKPTIELDDFFEFLDPKVVEKIMQTPAESRSRIVQDVQNYEYDINGAQNILNSLG